MTQAAAIAVFVYRRPEHARRLLASLLRNPLALESPLSFYCDGPRGEADAAQVERVRAVVREMAPPQARIVERARNLGLAASVIAGVSEQVEAHGEAIVLEDDLELSPFALDYFNAALARYRGDERVMHVSGYMYPVQAELPETFFYREATCWGWATWARAWRHFEPDAARIRGVVLERGERSEFDIRESMGFFEMLEKQMRGEIDSWAIRWYGSLRMRSGLALHPGRSLVRNTGLDGSGVHGGSSAVGYAVELSAQSVKSFPDRVEEDASVLAAMMAYRRRPGWRHRLDHLRHAWRRWKQLP